MQYMTIREVIEKAKKELAELTGFKSVAAISARRIEGKKWKVLVEIVEKKSIPEGMDVLGIYEVILSENGSILKYDRKALRRRQDVSVAGEEIE